jgi:sugar lactone lactonase YvrE
MRFDMQARRSARYVALTWCVALGAISCSSDTPATSSDAAATCPVMEAGLVDVPVAVDAPEMNEDAPSSGALPSQQEITLTTVYKSPLVVEGLTADRAGNLYAAGRAGTPCPVWRVPSGGGVAVVVGNLPSPCQPLGLAFDSAENLFIADADKVYTLTPSEASPPDATVFASGVPGANGIAFDRRGSLWVSDGGTGQGRVWSITPEGVVSERFRVQPLASEVNAMPSPDGGAGSVGGVGRDTRALPPGSLNMTPAARTAADAVGSVALVANGLSFASDGTLFVADTARGAIWRVALDGAGAVTSALGCDTTFAADTLCFDDLFVAHPALEGIDGIALDVAGNIFAVANERNAIVVVTPRGVVHELYRNPPDATTRLRNAGPLEFPTSPFLVGRKLCVTQSDVARRDNFPNSGGEVGPATAGAPLAKISCLDPVLPQVGLALPVQ